MLTACVFILSVVIFLVPTVVAFNFLLKWNGVGWGAAGSWVAGVATPLAVIAAFHASAGARRAADRQTAQAQAALKFQIESEQHRRELESCVRLVPVLLNLARDMDRADRAILDINSALASFEDQSPEAEDWEARTEANARRLKEFRESARTAYTDVLLVRLTVQSQEFRQMITPVERQVTRVNSYLQTWWEQIVIDEKPAQAVIDEGWSAALVGDRDLHDVPAPAIGLLRNIAWDAQNELRRALLSTNPPSPDHIL